MPKTPRQQQDDSIYQLRNHSSGIANFIKEDQNPYAYWYSQCLDTRTDPYSLTLLPATQKESGSVVTDLLKFADLTPFSLITYAIGDSGNFYQRDNTGSWSLIAQMANSHGNGLAYFYGDNFIYTTGDNTIGRYGPTTVTTSAASSPTGVTVPRGWASSGLEFGSNIPGALNIDYFESTQNTFNYFASKGLTTVRIPFSWERFQPTLGGSLDATYKSYIDDQITKAGNAGMKVILDCHNYGRRKFYLDGGITENFTAQYPALLYPWADYSQAGNIILRDYGQSFFGTVTDPNTGSSYTITWTMQFNSRDTSFGGEGLYVRPFYIDANNYYEFSILNDGTNTWVLKKVVASSSTTLKSGTFGFSWGTNISHTFVIDVGQATSGKINILLDGVALYTNNTASTDAALTGGKVGFYAPGVHVQLSTMILNISGDTSSGGISVKRVGDSGLTAANFASLWDKISLAYAANTTVLGYDLMNEPHDMPVPTTSSNYNSTATVTVMFAAAITAIRANDSAHYIIVENDHWAGGQNFTTDYGANPTPWYTDATGKLVYSFHYYFDNDHSGSYPIAFASTNNTNISGDVTPIMQWAKNHAVNLYCGEYGVPNQSDWLVCETTFLDLCNLYNVWATHWAAGDAYSSITTLQPTGSSPSYVDQLQMSIIGQAKYLQNTQATVIGSTTTQPQFVNDFLTAQGGVPQNTYSLLLQSASSQYASAADDATLEVVSDLTLEAYVYLNSLPAVGSSMSILGKWDESSTTKSYLMDIYAISGYFGDGADGALTVSVNTTEAPIDSSCSGTAGDDVLLGTNSSFASGQYILIHQTQGANAGQWERNVITGYTPGTVTLSGTLPGNIALQTPLKGTYTTGAQVRVINRYTNVTVNNGVTWTAKAWNGTTGGILAFLANGIVTINGTISADLCGFRGGTSTQGQTLGWQGEGTAGIGIQSNAANGNGGGGGQITSDLHGQSQGGGGGNGTPGQTGGTDSSLRAGGIGGASIGSSDLSTMNLGGGAGGGAEQNSGSTANGKNGGGIIFITCVNMTNAGLLSTNGGSGLLNGGSGGGGSILLQVQTATFGTNLITANGGASYTNGSAPVASGGGQGRVAVSFLTSFTGTANPTINGTQDNALVTTPSYQLRLHISPNGTLDEILTFNLTSLSISQWNRFSVTWVASSAKATFYQNGSKLGTLNGSSTAINSNASLLYIGANKGASAVQNFLDAYIDDVRVWSGAQDGIISAYDNHQLTGTEGGLEAYYLLNNAATDSAHSNNLTLHGSPAYSTNVPFIDNTVRLDIDQSYTTGGQDYDLLTALSETTANWFPFTPLYDPQKAIDINVGTKGTGDWTVTIHDQTNRVIATKTIKNANMASSGYQMFIWDAPWRIVIGHPYHVHITSTVADGTVVTSTDDALQAAGAAVADFHTYYQFLVTDTFSHPIARMLNFLVIGNERYLATWDGAFFQPNLIAFPQGTHVRCFGYWGSYLAIGTWQEQNSGTANIYDFPTGKIYFWDGISLTFNFYIDVPEGQVNAIYGMDADLYYIAGWKADLMFYRGSFANQSGSFNGTKVKRIPYLETASYIETYPQAMAMWQGLLYFGMGGNSDSTTFKRNIYSWGTLYPQYPQILTSDHVISTGNNGSSVKIGLVFPVGKKLLVGWKDGISFGADIIDPDGGVFYKSGYLQTTVQDGGSVWHNDLLIKTRADHLPLTGAQGVKVGAYRDRSTVLELANCATDPSLRITGNSLENGRVGEYMAQVNLSGDGTSSPTVLALQVQTNTLDSEEQF